MNLCDLWREASEEALRLHRGQHGFQRSCGDICATHRRPSGSGPSLNKLHVGWSGDCVILPTGRCMRPKLCLDFTTAAVVDVAIKT